MDTEDLFLLSGFSESAKTASASSCPPSPLSNPCSCPLLCKVEVHFVVDILALRVEAFQDLRQHVDGLLAAQTGALGLELLQQVFGGHRLTDEVAPHCFLCQLHIAAEEINRRIFTY